MFVNKPVIMLASAAALTLALSQGTLAETAAGESTPAAAAAGQDAPVAPPAPAAAESAAPSQTAATATSSAPPAPAPTPAPVAETAEPPTASPAEAPPATPTVDETASSSPAGSEAAAPPPPPPQVGAAQERMEQRRAEMMAERKRRYKELRERAAEVGLDLPETPPWEQVGAKPPEMPSPPAMPAPRGPGSGKERAGMTAEERDAVREQRYQAMRERAMERGVELPETPPWKLMSDDERQAHWEKMRNMAPEERRAMREENWKEMTKRAKEQGVELPETPPWKQAEQRREEVRAKWEAFRKTVDEMTPEQKEAAQAIFGQEQRRPLPPSSGRQMPRRMPMQGPYGQDFGAPGGFGQGPMMPGYGYGPQGSGRSAPPWFGSEEGMRQGPPPPASNYNRGW